MMTRLGRRNLRDEQGAVAILTAFLMVGLILCAGIVVDLGNARDVRRQSQNASDASSLAGANALYPTGACSSGAKPCITDAVAAAKLYALQNFQVSATDWANCRAPAGSALASTPDGADTCISFNSASTLVRVYMPTRTVPTFFGRIAGMSTIPVGSNAQAQIGTAVSCSLCFLGNMDAGNGDLTVTGGSIAVNGDVTAGPNSYWNAASIGVVGTWDTSANPSIPVTTIPAFGDPLLGTLTMPLVTTGLLPKTDPCSATATGGTGTYGAISIGNNVTCHLQAGLYVISDTWELGNHSLLTGTGVTLYVKSAAVAGGPSGYLKFKNGDAIFTAPTTTPLNGVPVVDNVPAGYAIIYDRDNSNPLELQGNGTTFITGAVYAPDSKLDFNGTTCFGFDGGPFIFGSGYTNGNPSCVTVTHAISTIVSRTLLHLNQ
jgi:Flp pilus assembly protein TadG